MKTAVLSVFWQKKGLGIVGFKNVEEPFLEPNSAPS